MMAVDASAALAIYFAEPERDAFVQLIARASRRIMSPVNAWEVVARAWAVNGDEGRAKAQGLLVMPGIEIEPIDAVVTDLAIEALTRFGGRPARLNMGDCFAYALAKSREAPLLFKGEDFLHTDIQRV